MTPGVELIVVMLVFVGLLTAGMTIPFAILVPSVLYLMMHAGLAGLKGIGLVSWGSMNSFTLSAIPLFILMAEILQESQLSLRVYHGLSKLVSWIPGGLLQTADPALSRLHPSGASPCRNCRNEITVRGCPLGRWRQAAHLEFSFRRA